MNEIRLIPWKGQTFTQITSYIRRNENTGEGVTNHNFFIPPPLKIYRREIAVDGPNTCTSKPSTTVLEMMDIPGGTIVNSAFPDKGLENTLDFNLTNNTTEIPGNCTACNSTDSNGTVFFSPAENAKRRVRSSGMIKRQFDISKNNDTYYTNTKQYLVSRNSTFEQNQYNYIRNGNSTAKPGDPSTSDNQYSPNGINHCKKYFIAMDTSFQYQWIDACYNTVNVPSGYYSVDDLNATFQLAMTQNHHFYVNNMSQAKLYLLNIGYNSITNTVELQTSVAGGNTISPSDYSLPAIYDYSTPVPTPIIVWQTPSFKVVPGFKINNNIFQQAIGFSAGNYPSVAIPRRILVNNTVQTLSNGTFSSSFTPGVKPNFVRINYKPNNPQYAQQGAVSSSSLITRLKYNTITNNTAVYRNALGKATANALAYGVPENGYTIKDKIGYPNKQTPVFSQYSDGYTCNAGGKTVSMITKQPLKHLGSMFRQPLL